MNRRTTSTHNASEKVSKSALTHERILNIAAACFLQDGYRDTRMTRIAAQCGISRAAIYKYFPTKESILLALNEKVLKDALQTTRAILKSPEPAPAVIEEWLRDNLCDQDAQGLVRVLVFEEVQGILVADQQSTDDALKHVKNALAKVIRRGIKAGDINSGINPRDTAHMLQGLVFSIKRNNLSARSVVDLNDARHIELLITTTIAGLRAARG